jgi:hypothetical protein
MMNRFYKTASRQPQASVQRGFVAILLLVMIGIGAITAMTAGLWGANPKELERARTRAALEQAKAAVLAYVELGNNATSANLFDGINGRLPCPNLNGDGVLDPTCGAAGESRLGLIPWSTLGVEPPRDASNECLWLAVAGAFKNTPATPGTNADSDGVFTVIQPVQPSAGTTAWTEKVLVGNTTALAPKPSMAVAVIIAPGRNRAAQTRASTSTQRCPLTTPASATTSAPNYLDAYTTASGTTFDNSALTATPLTPKTYVQADNDHELLNDELIWITADEFARAASRRALRVVAGAINNFVYGDALSGSNAAGTIVANGYYPRPAATPGGICEPGRLQGFVPSTCAGITPGGIDFSLGNRMTPPQDFERWLNQIHYEVSPHCVIPPATAPTTPISNACLGGSSRLTVGNDNNSIQSLLIIRGRDITRPITCTTGIPTTNLSSCIDDVDIVNRPNRNAILNINPSLNMPFLMPPNYSNNFIYLFR